MHPKRLRKPKSSKFVLRISTLDSEENYNYVVRLNTVDVDTGEPIMVNEYRTIASNVELSNSSVLSRIVALIEEICDR